MPRVLCGHQGSELELDFTYIDDIVTGCVGAVDRACVDGRGGRVPHVPCGQKVPVTVSYLVDRFVAALGKEVLLAELAGAPGRV